MYKDVSTLIETIHFNKEIPENQNIKYKSQKQNLKNVNNVL